MTLDIDGRPFSKDWADAALRWVRDYAGTHRVFRAEHVRINAESRGFPKPEDARAWGAVMRRARVFGWIEFVRYEPARIPTRHGGPVSVWRSRICGNANA